jgi:hypothetical protein
MNPTARTDAGFPKKRATFKRSGKLSFGADFGLSH